MFLSFFGFTPSIICVFAAMAWPVWPELGSEPHYTDMELELLYRNTLPVPHINCKYSECGSIMTLTYVWQYDYIHGFVPPHQHNNDTGSTNANAVGSEVNHSLGTWPKLLYLNMDCKYSENGSVVTLTYVWQYDYVHGFMLPHEHIGSQMDHSPGTWKEELRDGRVMWSCTHQKGFQKWAMPMTETGDRWTDGPKMWILEPKATAVTAAGRRIQFDWQKNQQNDEWTLQIQEPSQASRNDYLHVVHRKNRQSSGNGRVAVRIPVQPPVE